MIVSVKGGQVTSSQVRDLRGVIEREKAAIGVFLTLEESTPAMRKEAADAGFWQTRSVAGTRHPRIQILTVQDLLDGKRLDLPAQQAVRSFKQAAKQRKKTVKDLDLF